jgi:MFS family permease
LGVTQIADTTQGRLFTREFLILLATGTSLMLGSGAILAILPVFVVDELGGTELTAGIVMGSAAVPALLSRAWLGRMSDRRGAQRLVSLGGAGTALGMALLIALPSVVGAVLARLVMGAGGAAFFIGSTVRAMELAPEDRRSQAAAFNLVAVHIGMGLGPMGGEWVLGWSGFGAVWWTIVVLSFVSAALSLGLSHRPGDPTAEPSPLIHRASILPGIITLCGIFGFNGFIVFAALYSDSIGMNSVGPVFLVSSGTLIVTRAVFGRVPDILGPVRVASCALVLTILATVLLAVWASPLGFFVGAGLVALGLSLQSPSLMVVAVDGVSDRERGSAMATYTAFFDLANALVGPVMGLLVTWSGYRLAFLVAAGVAGLALVLTRVLLAQRWYASHPPRERGTERLTTQGLRWRLRPWI